MRVFLRGINQSLIVDHDMEIKVLEIHADRVRLGITSPGEIPPYREETVYLEPPGVDSDLELVESSNL
jgi:carbon storage regulator CsrA